MAEGKRRHKPALIVLVVVAAIACLGLAWWQWSRFESSGSGQNLGYALQWPAFGIMFVYAYRRFVVLESDPDEVAKLAPGAHTEIPADLLPPRPGSAAPIHYDDDSPPDVRELAEYNRYLSELAGRENGLARQENK